jgi:hypothetical protein
MKKISILLAMLLVCSLSAAQEMKSPDKFYGYEPGSNHKLVGWSEMVDYFKHLDSSSGRITVTEVGKSTLGKPWLVAVVSSEDNLKNAETYKQINRQLTDPTGLKPEQIGDLTKQGKFTIAMSFSMHSTEVAPTQSVSRFAYDIITDESPLGKKIRDNCILVLFPCFNPDGLDMVKEWNDKTLFTKYFGSRLPYLYHKYVGHNINRDGFMISQAESRNFSKVMYQEWFPQAYIDHHQMGSSGARLYIPPYFDPVQPDVDPLIWREHLLYGSLMAIRLEQKGHTGIETGSPFTAWWRPSFHMITNYHNITGMLTETASCNLASPRYIHPHQLRGGSRGRYEYKATVNFPNPWPGGWWTLMEMVKQIQVASHASLELGALNREMLLNSMAQKAKRQIEKGKSEPPYAYLVPEKQHDRLTMLKMLEIMQFSGVKIHRSKEEIIQGDARFPAGTFILKLDQPMRPYLKALLGKNRFPDNNWTRQRDGSPLRPYDLTTYTLAEFMGVKTIPATELLRAEMALVKSIELPDGNVVGEGENGYLLCHSSNDSFIAVNRILKAGGSVEWLGGAVKQKDFTWPEGTMLVKAEKALINKLSKELHLDFHSAPAELPEKNYKLNPLRLGLYHRYQGGNMDEGWNRFIFDKFEFPYSKVLSKEVQAGKLREKYDVFLLSADRLDTLKGPDYKEKKPGDPETPEEYQSGLGDEGIKALKEFVSSGGTLIALDNASELVIEEFKVPIENVLEGISSNEFFCPGSTLKMNFDTTNPIAYGMPDHGLGLFVGSPAFAVRSNFRNQEYKVVASYPERDILESGWLIGEKYLAGKASVVEMSYGQGKIILIGFRSQNRSQTHGTFKLLFNSIYYGSVK